MILYKHINCTDVAIRIDKKCFIFEKGEYKIKITWFSIVNPKNVHSMMLKNKVFIKLDDMKNWKKYDV